MATMVPSPRRRHIQQLANMLRDKSMSLKLENIFVFTIVFISYFKARCIADTPCLCLRVASAGGAESIILSTGSADNIIISAGGAKSMMLSAFAEIMRLSAPVITSVVSATTDVKSIATTTVTSAAAFVATFSTAAFS
jgi:hypothetical protein